MPSFINLFAHKITAIISKDDTASAVHKRKNSYSNTSSIDDVHSGSNSANDSIDESSYSYARHSALRNSNLRLKELEFENLRLKQSVDKYHNLYKMTMNVNKEINVKVGEMEQIIGENNEILDKQALYILNVRDELLNMKNVINEKDRDIMCLKEKIMEKKKSQYVSRIALPKPQKSHV